ncbi:MAG: ATP-binding protein [Flavobacteriia bacterium]|jgi:DNA polymerase-3 subunit delta'
MLFKDVVGQEDLKHHFIQEINEDKISHAQLFLGNAGNGTLPLALAFIQYLFCDNRQAKDSCGQCSSCLKVSELKHPDLHFSFPVVQTISKFSDPILPDWRQKIAENPYFSLNNWTDYIDDKARRPIISAEESLAIIKKLTLKSFEGKYKVMLIWMAEEMNATCANKLLKILEEPPAKTLFILVSENAENMLQTILSRTQLTRVPAIQTEELAKALSEKHKIDSSSALSIAAQAEGNMIEAEDLVNVSDQKNLNREMFITLMRVCWKKMPIPMMDWAEDISTIGRDKQKTFLKYALHMFRQSMLRNYTENQLTKTSKEEEDFLKNFAQYITGKNIFDLMENFNDAIYHVDRNANPKILFTELCFRVMRMLHQN